MAKLTPGDVVVVTKLDRLGRSTRELLDLIDRIGKAGARQPLMDSDGKNFGAARRVPAMCRSQLAPDVQPDARGRATIRAWRIPQRS